MDLGLKTQNFSSADQSWIVDPDYAGKVGCTIDLALFGSGQLTGFTDGAQGRIPAGTALGKKTSGGKFGPYDDSKSDGTETFAGYLWDDVPFVAGATTGSLGASRVVFGMVYVAKLPLTASSSGTPGRIDAAGQADTVVKIVHI